jgi:hypothetical protein
MYRPTSRPKLHSRGYFLYFVNNSVEASLRTLRPSVHSCTNDRLVRKTRKVKRVEDLTEVEPASAKIADPAVRQGKRDEKKSNTSPS